MPQSTIKPEYKEFLDELRESTEINMFAAGKPLGEAFPELSRVEIKTVILTWMKEY